LEKKLIAAMQPQMTVLTFNPPLSPSFDKQRQKQRNNIIFVCFENLASFIKKRSEMFLAKQSYLSIFFYFSQSVWLR